MAPSAQRDAEAAVARALGEAAQAWRAHALAADRSGLPDALRLACAKLVVSAEERDYAGVSAPATYVFGDLQSLQFEIRLVPGYPKN